MKPINQADSLLQPANDPLPIDTGPQPVIQKIRPSTTLRFRPEDTQYCTPFNHLFEDYLNSKNNSGMGSIAVAGYYIKEDQKRKEEQRRYLTPFAPMPGTQEYLEWLKKQGGTPPKVGFKPPAR